MASKSTVTRFLALRRKVIPAVTNIALIGCLLAFLASTATLLGLLDPQLAFGGAFIGSMVLIAGIALLLLIESNDSLLYIPKLPCMLLLRSRPILQPVSVVLLVAFRPPISSS